MFHGALIQLTGLLAFTTRKSKDLIPDFIRSAQKLWMLLLRIGLLITIGFFLQQYSFTCICSTRNVNCSNLEDGVHWNSWVHDWQVLNSERNLIIKGKANHSIFTRKHLNFEMVALRISFSCVPRSNNKQGFCTTPQGVCDQCAN